MTSRALAAALLTATIVAGACGGGDDPEVVGGDGGDATTTSTAGGDVAATVPPEDNPGSVTVDGKRLDSSAQPGPPLATAPAPPAAGSPAATQEAESTQAYRPAPGVYRYVGDNAGEAAETTIRVEEIGEERAGFRVRQTALDVGGSGQVREILWSADAVRADRQHNVRGQEEAGRCDWQPDFLQYALPLEVGRRWEVDTTCRSTDPTRPGYLAEKSSVRVTEKRRVTVGDVATTVFVLESEGTNTAVAGGVTVIRRRRATELWSPRYGVVVEESGTSTTEAPPNDRPPLTFRYKLVNLRPS